MYILSCAREVGSPANPPASYGLDTQPFSPLGVQDHVECKLLLGQISKCEEPFCLACHSIYSIVLGQPFHLFKMLYVTKPDIFCIPCKPRVCKFKKNSMDVKKSIVPCRNALGFLYGHAVSALVSLQTPG